MFFFFLCVCVYFHLELLGEVIVQRDCDQGFLFGSEISRKQHSVTVELPITFKPHSLPENIL